MALDIEKRIVAGGKVVIIANLPAEYKVLDYQEPEQFTKNNFQGKNKRFGWTSGTGVNAENSAPLQHQAIDHNFNFILMTDYNNQDDDVSQEAAKSELQELILTVIKEMRKTKVNAVAEVCNVVIGAIDDPVFLDDNSVIVYVTTVVINYRYRI